jgi:hypothetical protein
MRAERRATWKARKVRQKAARCKRQREKAEALAAKLAGAVALEAWVVRNEAP